MTREAHSIAIVGGGPRGAGLLERLVANLPQLLPDTPVDLHVVEPFPFGAGRIWRWDQSPLLWANSQAEDMTMFTDASSSIAGPVRPGPTFQQWAAEQPASVRLTDELAHQAESVHGMTFASRLLVHEYLTWFFWQAVQAAPSTVRVHLHADRAVDLTTVATDDGERQQLHLAGRATPLTVDAVLLAQGHLGTHALGESGTLAAAAEQWGLTYLPEAYTADADLDRLQAGQPVVVRGAGLAFVDLAVLVGQGRGGQFVQPSDPAAAEELRYLPSGREPRLLVGSRRGVPYRAKITYRLQGPRAPHLTFLDPVTVEALLLSDSIDVRTQVWPLVAKELALGHYHELFHAHPEAVRGSWEEALRALTRYPWGSPELDDVIARLVPDAADRLDLDTLDRPLAGRSFESPEALQAAVIAHLEADLRRRRDPRHSADLGVFNALLAVIEPVARIISSGRVTLESAVRDVPWFFGFFSYFASGPPPQRLGEVLALARAGVVQFLGPDVEVSLVSPQSPEPQADPAFVAASPAVPGQHRAHTLVEARVPRASVSGTDDDLLAALFARGEVTEQVISDSTGTRRIPTGRLHVDPATAQVVDAAGQANPGRYAFGSGTSAATPGAFSRPNTDAAFFRQNDHSVRHLLQHLAARPPRTDVGGTAVEVPLLELWVRRTRRDRLVARVLEQARREDDARHSPSYRGAPGDGTPADGPVTGPADERADERADDGPEGLGAQRFVLLVAGTHPVAAAAYTPLEGDAANGTTAALDLVWADPDHRGRGHARQVLDALEELAAGEGITALVAAPGPRALEARQLLTSRGWRTIRSDSGSGSALTHDLTTADAATAKEARAS